MAKKNKKAEKITKKVLKHIKADDKEFRAQIADDVKLSRELKSEKKSKKSSKKKDPKRKSPEGKKVTKVMHEWGQGKLHSGSKKGPVVKNQKQAVAIALSEQRKANNKKKKKK